MEWSCSNRNQSCGGNQRSHKSGEGEQICRIEERLHFDNSPSKADCSSVVASCHAHFDLQGKGLATSNSVRRPIQPGPLNNAVLSEAEPLFLFTGLLRHSLVIASSHSSRYTWKSALQLLNRRGGAVGKGLHSRKKSQDDDYRSYFGRIRVL